MTCVSSSNNDHAAVWGIAARLGDRYAHMLGAGDEVRKFGAIGLQEHEHPRMSSFFRCQQIPYIFAFFLTFLTFWLLDYGRVGRSGSQRQTAAPGHGRPAVPKTTTNRKRRPDPGRVQVARLAEVVRIVVRVQGEARRGKEEVSHQSRIGTAFAPQQPCVCRRAWWCPWLAQPLVSPSS